MDPCPFLRLVIGNLAVKFPGPTDLQSLACYCKYKLKGFPTQVSNIPFCVQENETIDNKAYACFSLSKPELIKLAEQSNELKIQIYRGKSGRTCGFLHREKLVGRVVVQLDLKGVLESNGNNRVCVVQNGWVLVNGGTEAKLHVNVRVEPDPRFVFQFDGEPECSPQVFQVNGNVKQPVFSCKFGFRNSGERNLRSRSSLSEPSTSTSCFGSVTDEEVKKPVKERKGWSITIHDLSGSPVAAASIVTPFVPSSPGSDSVSKSNPGAWLILRPGQGTWKPWGRLEAWRESSSDNLGYRFELVPDGSVDTIPVASSTISTKKGGKFCIDVTTGPTPMMSPNGSFDLSSTSVSGSGSEFGSTVGSGSWPVHHMYRGFVMSSTVVGDGKPGKPVVEVGFQHVNCTEDAAVFVALAAAMDLSMDACRLFSERLRKELRQRDL